MSRRWHDISAQNERWTVATWLLFAGLFVFYGACLWVLTGWGPAWLHMAGTCFGAAGTWSFTSVSYRRATFFTFCLGVIVLAVPIALNLLPTLGTLLYIMKRANGGADRQSGE